MQAQRFKGLKHISAHYLCSVVYVGDEVTSDRSSVILNIIAAWNIANRRIVLVDRM